MKWAPSTAPQKEAVEVAGYVGKYVEIHHAHTQQGKLHQGLSSGSGL